MDHCWSLGIATRSEPIESASKISSVRLATRLSMDETDTEARKAEWVL